MIPVKFPEQNSVYKRESCMDLPTFQGYNDQFNAPEITSCWEFTDDEIQKIKDDIENGKRPQLFLSVIGGQPPVALFMRDKE